MIIDFDIDFCRINFLVKLEALKLIIIIVTLPGPSDTGRSGNEVNPPASAGPGGVRHRRFSCL